MLICRKEFFGGLLIDTSGDYLYELDHDAFLALENVVDTNEVNSAAVKYALDALGV